MGRLTGGLHCQTAPPDPRHPCSCCVRVICSSKVQVCRQCAQKVSPVLFRHRCASPLCASTTPQGEGQCTAPLWVQSASHLGLAAALCAPDCLAAAFKPPPLPDLPAEAGRLRPEGLAALPTVAPIMCAGLAACLPRLPALAEGWDGGAAAGSPHWYCCGASRTAAMGSAVPELPPGFSANSCASSPLPGPGPRRPGSGRLLRCRAMSLGLMLACIGQGCGCMLFGGESLGPCRQRCRL